MLNTCSLMPTDMDAIPGNELQLHQLGGDQNTKLNDNTLGFQ